MEWVNLGEGKDGDYDPSDKDDVNLLRLDASEKQSNGEFEAPDGAECSLCTGIPASATRDQQIEGLRLAMDRLYPIYQTTDFYNLKRTLEGLSWMDLSWLKPNSQELPKPSTTTINSNALIGLLDRSRAN